MALARLSEARALLVEHVGAGTAAWLVAVGIALDLAIGFALLWRRWVRRAAVASIVVASGYLVAGTWLTPELWADPLGPLLKVLPAVGLALAVAALAEER